ncbi:MAG: hypothetical protein CVU44_19035 [Chloroflexi bacterium HGW-Chloroflexi-6]|nr:MAG: hypothetical protein CVU44_19035 [Chloroflexi bacterium HGW-Chloroflexi-6]
MEKEHEQHIESRLSQALLRVTPSHAFVNTVRGRIQDSAPQVMVEKFSERRKAVLFTLGGVLSASLLILTLARVAYYLIGRSRQSA